MHDDSHRAHQSEGFARGRLDAQPVTRDLCGYPPGLHALGLDQRDAWLYVPETLPPGRPAPFLLGLHGAGGNGRRHVGHMTALAEEHGMVVLAPSSRQQSWDVLYGGFGPDVACINRALRQVFQDCAVDRSRLAIEGFSDGASYAPSLGITNGDLFSHIIAYSPGFLAPAGSTGSPEIFVSHGVNDRVLPIDRCSRRVVPRLRQAGYEVEYHEFDGPHTVPEDVAEQAITWFLGRGS